MSKFDFDAHACLSNESTDVQRAVQLANKKASLGRFLVCITTAGNVLVLPEFSASVRDDIAETIYDTVSGYNFSANDGAAS